MKTHTEEPWQATYYPAMDSVVLETEHEEIARFFGGSERGMLPHRANAERAVACVNGCKGINPKVVKVAIYALKRLIDELPSKRDWLDPELERIARDVIAESEFL